jgi:hypothetical protein
MNYPIKEVVPGLLWRGPEPAHGDLPGIAAQGVKNILCLEIMPTLEDYYARESGIKLYRMPWSSFRAPSIEQLDAAVDFFIHHPQTLFH